MDSIDEDIISAIYSGTIRYSSLGKQLGLPVSTVHFRVKRLEREKIVKYYRGEIDWKKAGLSLTAFISINVDVDLLKSLKKSQKQLLDELLGITYVKEGHIITGDADIILKVIARDSEHLGKILLNSIDAKQGVVRTKTIIVL